MANVTDPLIRAVQGTDPQNLMEYITRQKIYDSRFWKEECFGLTAADVLEKAAKTLTCIGGTFGGNHRPSKFLSLTLKLLQLQPDLDLVLEFINQDHFKYVKALGAFYLRLTGRPVDIYETLEPLYAEYSKLRFRDVTEWKIIHMDEFIHELFTQPIACGIAMPRLPHREVLQTDGYLEDGPRLTALKEVIEEAGGLKEYLNFKIEVEQSQGAIAVWERFYGKRKEKKIKEQDKKEQGEILDEPVRDQFKSIKRKQNDDDNDESGKKKKKKKPKYGTLFKTKTKSEKRSNEGENPQQLEEGSVEYWNEERAKLGLKALK